MGSLATKVLIVLFIVVGILYIVIISKISELDTKARDAGSNIDSSIWEISHFLNLIAELLKKHGTIVPDELNVTPVLALGMSAGVQFTTYIDLMSKKESLLKLLEENAAASASEEAATYRKRLADAETDIVGYSLKYNKRANELNAFLDKPIISWFGQRKGYTTRGNFFPQSINNDAQ